MFAPRKGWVEKGGAPVDRLQMTLRKVVIVMHDELEEGGFIDPVETGMVAVLVVVGAGEGR